jgi:hypothetical protein
MRDVDLQRDLAEFGFEDDEHRLGRGLRERERTGEKAKRTEQEEAWEQWGRGRMAGMFGD